MKKMKKICIILGVIVALVIGGGVYSYAYVPNSCSYVSGASVSGSSSIRHGSYTVTLRNYSGSRCSASFTVEGKTIKDGVWEVVSEGILTADNNRTEYSHYSMDGYSQMRLINISTWKCD